MHVQEFLPFFNLLTVQTPASLLQKIVHTVELAGRVMEELAKTGGPRQEVVNVQCQEFMQAVKVSVLILGPSSEYI